MNPEEVWKSAKRKAWLVGGVLGLLGGVISAGVGAFSGLCCLFQFANAIMPALLGLLGGGIGAATAKWADFAPGEGGAGAGAGLGFRAGGLAAILAGLLGFAFTLLWPIVMVIISAFESKADVMEQLVGSVAVLAMGAGMALLFTGGGTLLGMLLGAAAGAIGGMIFGKK